MKKKLTLLLVFGLTFCKITSFAQGSGSTLKFDGISTFVDVGDQVANGCRTIEMWFKPSVNITSSNNTPLSLIVRDFDNGSSLGTDEFGLYFSPSSWQNGANTGKLTFLRRIGSTIIQISSDNNSWEADHWYHVCATIDPVSGMKLYINGILQQEIDPSTNPIGTQSGFSSDKVSIGRWGNFNIRHFNGEIDEVRFWETDRTQIEIREKMCSSLTGNEPGLRAYWKFNTGTGSTLVDNSINNYSGTLQAMTNANWVYSGAPIGDVSTYNYPGNLSGTSITLSPGLGDSFTVDNFNSSALGVQVYKVSSLPNVTNNLSLAMTKSYYGVFLTSTNGTVNIAYDYSVNGCSNCDEIFTRNDNADLNWQQILSSSVNCEFNLVNESSVGYDYRGEYIISRDTIIGLVDFLGNDTTLCAGSSLIIGTQVVNSTYLWQDNSIADTLLVNQSGHYWLEVDSGCSISRDSIYIDYVNFPIVDLGNDSVLCQGESLILDATTTNATYSWQNNSLSPTLSVSQNGVYWTEVSVNNCSTRDTIEIEVDDCGIDIKIPNVFSPNNDGINDKFAPIVSLGIVSKKTTIYNRWGGKVFETDNILEEWSGHGASEATYYWVVSYTDINGVEGVLNGFVLLIR